MAPETVIASFILRFVKPGGEAGNEATRKAGLRIAVRQVQSGYERRFAKMDDAMRFIRDEIEILEQA